MLKHEKFKGKKTEIKTIIVTSLKLIKTCEKP